MKIKIINRIILLFSIGSIISCSPAVYNIGTFVNKDKVGKKFDKIYIVSMLKEPVNNAIVETDFMAEGNKRGIASVKNVKVAPISFTNNDIARDEILARVAQEKCDGIFTIGLLNVKNESRYVSGTTSTGMYYNPNAFGYYNQFPGYYNHYYGAVSTPGYYVNDQIFYIECNLFDAVTNELVFSIQSKTYNPDDIRKISKAYCLEIFKTLEKEKLIKPQASK